MEGLILFLILFPFFSAALFALIKNNTARKYITYISAALIISCAVIFAVLFFSGGKDSVSFFSSAGALSEYAKYIIVAAEVFLVALICVLSFKYKKYYCALLSVAQTALTFWYEFSGAEPELLVSNIYVDRLSVIMLLIVAVVGSLITIYACGYMKDYCRRHPDVADRRPFFFALMYVFLGAMCGLVLSNSLIWLYFFWEITSVVSFLLISYTKTPEAVKNSFRALWMNLFGGLSMAVGIVIFGQYFGVTDLQSVIAFAPGSSQLIIIPVALLALAALTKSAQLPFSSWLLGAMVAPTPSSALLHSATMVKAGVYLLIRLSPVMQGQITGNMVAYIGGFTFLAASMFAITVSDGKKVLAYSTVSNLGLIAMCAGIGTTETVWAGIFLIIFHAVSKSLCFQTVGSIENATGSREIESMRGLIKRYPWLALTLCVGMMCMYLAPFGMLISKWAALKSLIDSSSSILAIIICFGSATTLVYWTKWITTIISSTHHDRQPLKNKTSANQFFSLIVHTVISVALCFVFPFISKAVVNPYVTSVYGDSSDVISSGNLFLMMMILALVIIVPTCCYLTTKHTKFKKVDRYIAGVNAGDQESFYDSFGDKRSQVLSNWYMDNFFGEKHLYKPCVVVSVCFIVYCVGVIATLSGITLF
ncbi:MAG: NADH-quinone oxidoreductase subunit L [Clostridiales bacterium]|nr:NADH-quinone oxidoreductase subunit L [Clostridiales bacterium]